MRPRGALALVPGLAACAAIATAAEALHRAEIHLRGSGHLDSFVLAILLGIAVASTRLRSRWLDPGVRVASVLFLEIAVALLGLTVDFGRLLAVGPWLLASVVAVVLVTIGISVQLGRMIGIDPKVAVLVACGNAICGNSAIAAIAPAIGARKEDVVAAIAFSALLSVVVVIGLPFAGIALDLDEVAFGTFAGLTVYAVPQVVAATAPVGLLSTQIGTSVKLVRVLLLGPVVFVASQVFRQLDRKADPGVPAPRMSLRRCVPWFIPAFIVLAALRGGEMVPAAVVDLSGAASRVLFLIAMAALGLSVDLRAVLRVGRRLMIAITMSLAALAVTSYTAVVFLGV